MNVTGQVRSLYQAAAAADEAIDAADPEVKFFRRQGS
jgi:hypothetical protein